MICLLRADYRQLAMHYPAGSPENIDGENIPFPNLEGVIHG